MKLYWIAYWIVFAFNCLVGMWNIIHFHFWISAWNIGVAIYMAVVYYLDSIAGDRDV